MDHPDLVNKLFADITKTMRQQFHGWEQDVPHEGEKGGIRERRVAKFLKSMLPNCFGVGSGHIIDQEGNISSQIDIVIYNALDGVHLPIDSYYSLFPCECVHAAIEVKSTLTASSGNKSKGSIYDIVEAVTKVKSLRMANQNSPSNLPCIVFAYQSSWKNGPKKVMEWFHKFGAGKSIPEVTFILDPGFLLCKDNKQPLYTHLYEKAPLLKFVEELRSRMENVKISTPNLWANYIKWDDKDVFAEIYFHRKDLHKIKISKSSY